MLDSKNRLEASASSRAKTEEGRSTRVARVGPQGSRKQDRAVATRAQLLESARTIFARDGFEQARIEDIAALSGKTRGAFYANFKDKEDVFFAIFEEDIASDQEKIRRLLKKLDTAEQRVDALAAYLSELGRNRERTLLALEFKLYAIRHPHRRKRLAELHGVMRLRCSVPEIHEFLPELEQQSPREKQAGSLAIGAIMDGLALNRLFDPEALDEAKLEIYLKLCVRETLLAARRGSDITGA
jgi:AcrR family transcriptional regulator